MDPYLRLIAVGVRADCAADIVAEYKRRCDPAGLEQYINDLECRVEASDR